LSKEFALKDLGALHYFLDIKVQKNQQRINVQSEYTKHVFACVGMEGCKGTPTSLSSSEKIPAHEAELLGLKIPSSIEAWWVHCSVLLSRCPASHMLLIMSVSICMLPLLCIGHQPTAS
jgi:hypothetical protein